MCLSSFSPLKTALLLDMIYTHISSVSPVEMAILQWSSAHFYRILMDTPPEKVVVQTWDFAGQEMYYNMAHVFGTPAALRERVEVGSNIPKKDHGFVENTLW